MTHTDADPTAAAPSSAERAGDGADLWFGKDLSTPDPIPESAIERAVDLLRSGRLHRYGEQGTGFSEVSLLEQEFATHVGRRYCMAVNSCGAAMFLAMRALGVRPGDRVLTSSFTLAPVPGAIAHVGAQAVLVDTNDKYTADLDDLARKIESTDARVFLISHMRGHIADLEAVRALCDHHDVALVEDCAHTMGARWDGRYTGTWGQVGCFSAQTYKHINSGEGGLLVTDDDDVAAQVILMSGCYMMYGQHLLRPADAVFERWKYVTPNFSMRMSNLAAALLRPQIGMLEERGKSWNRLYAILEAALNQIAGISVPARSPREDFVASSIQFTLDLEPARIERFVQECDLRGLYIKWFGRNEPLAFTSTYAHWHYLEQAPQLPNAMSVMRRLLDLRIPPGLTVTDCACIGKIVAKAAEIAARPGLASSLP